jgi:flagellar biosynthesis GTPase FlhF
MPKEKNDIYCGINKVPKNMELGTPQQCVDLKQVRYYGKVELEPDVVFGRAKIRDSNYYGIQAKKIDLDIGDMIKTFNKLKLKQDLANENLENAYYAYDEPGLSKKEYTQRHNKIIKYEAQVTKIEKEKDKIRKKKDPIVKKFKEAVENQKRAQEREKKEEEKARKQAEKEIEKARKQAEKEVREGKKKKVKREEEIEQQLEEEFEEEPPKRVKKKPIKKKPVKKPVKRGRLKEFNRDCSNIIIPWRKKACEYNSLHPKWSNARVLAHLKKKGRLHN